MRNCIYVFMSLVLFFSACSQDESFQPEKTPDKNRVKLFAIRKTDRLTTRAALDKAYRWEVGETIRIKFLNGTANQQNFVKQYAAEWLKYANLHFEYVTSGNADVKIAFDWNDDYVTWSYVGTECRQVLQTSPSVNFGFLEEDFFDYEEIQAEVMQVFGHVLGLVYEHQSPTSGVQWNVPSLTKYLDQSGWSASQIKDFFTLLNGNESNYTFFDPLSIMIYSVNPRYTTDGYGVNLNTQLSETDINFIKTIYPARGSEPVAVLQTSKKIFNNYNSSGFFAIANSSEIVIDWGDGTRDTYKGDSQYKYIYHTYATNVVHSIKIYGSPESVTQLYCGGCEVTSLDVSGCKALEVLHCYTNRLTALDVTHNTALKDLQFSTNQLLTIDLTRNGNLEKLVSTGNQLSSLNVSANKKLKTLLCGLNRLNSLNLSANTLLEELGCGWNRLTNIGTAANVNLKILQCNDNQFVSLDLSNNMNIEQVSCISNPNLTSIKVPNSLSLRSLSLKQTPIVTNQQYLVNLANSLPYRNSQNQGDIYIGNSSSKKWIEEITTRKYWNIY